MGDRANVYFKNGETGIGVFTRWDRHRLIDVVSDVFSSDAFQSCIGDPEYATRIGVQGVLEELGASAYEAFSGYGLWTREGGFPDSDHDIIVVDVNSGKAYLAKDFATLDHGVPVQLYGRPTTKPFKSNSTAAKSSSSHARCTPKNAWP